MSENLNEKYRKIIKFLYDLRGVHYNELEIQIEIQVPKEDILNANVCHVKDNLYRINIFPGCLNLHYKIQNITERYTADDLKYFSKFEEFGAFEHFENDTYREDLNNLFATIILLHIFYHEYGHILAKHIDVSESVYEEYESTRNGSYETQEHEMIADWLSTNFVFGLMFHKLVPNNEIESEEILATLKQITILYWLSLTIEFQIFDSNHMKQINDFSTLTHPHPAVRLYYNIEAMRECMMNILNTYGLDDDQAEEGVKLIIDDLYIYIKSFLQITNTPIDIKKNDLKIIDCYIKLRDIPYKDGLEEKNYTHLIPLPNEYREEIEKYRVSQERSSH